MLFQLKESTDVMIIESRQNQNLVAINLF